MNVEIWPIERPIPYARNPRKIPQSAIDKVAASIKEFGWQQAIVVDEEGVILAGHTRLLAAQKLKLTEVPVKVASGLTKAQAKAFRIADNRTAREASDDEELLALEFTDLQALDFDIGLTGFDASEIEKLSGVLAPDGWEENWKGMPEFQQETSPQWTIKVHFHSEENRNDFAKVVGQPITDKTKYIWYPEEQIDSATKENFVSDKNEP